MKRSRLSYLPADTAFSPGLRRLAWLNIAVQAAFPLALAFTPAMAGAGDGRGWRAAFSGTACAAVRAAHAGLHPVIR